MKTNFLTTDHTGYLEYQVAGSNKTQDILKFLVQYKGHSQISYLSYNQTLTETINQTIVSVDSSRRKPAKEGIQRAQVHISWMIFLSPQPHTFTTQSKLTQRINVLVLFLCTIWRVGKLPHYHNKSAPIPWNYPPMDCLTVSKRWNQEWKQ